jgi:tripartite-type tricarboxylate transporter receptor subunit TctC
MLKPTLRALLAVAALAPALACAQAYPTKPIRMIVPSAPGGGPDIQSRLIAPDLSKQLGQQVLVDNRPGGNNIIGYEAIARATPDGYTFGMLTNTITTNPSVIAKLPYDTFKDFQPIVLQGSAPFLLSVTPSLPIHSVKDLTTYARANAGKLSYGSVGLGSASTLSVELFKAHTGTDIVRVSYKGMQQIVTDAIGNHIHIACENPMPLLPHVRAGRLRGLGITSLKRMAVAPDLPTLDEAGLANFEVVVVAGYALPAGAPRDIVMRLNAEINKALRVPVVVETFTASGAIVLGGTPEQFAEHIRTHVAKWAKVVKAAGITPQ